MAVRDHKSFLCISCRLCCCISGYFPDLFYRISDLLSVFLFSKVRPCIGPFVFAVQLNFPAALSVTCIELHLNAVRTDSILVISIIPVLGYCYFCCRWCRFFIFKSNSITCSHFIFIYTIIYRISFIICSLFYIFFCCKVSRCTCISSYYYFYNIALIIACIFTFGTCSFTLFTYFIIISTFFIICNCSKVYM